MPRLSLIVLLDSKLPPRIIMRMRNNKDLQLLTIPFTPFISDQPPLLPWAPINIQELDLIIEILGGDINSGGPNGVI